MENSRIWRKPQLVILARSTPEEAVLLGCKTSGQTQIQPNNHKNGCERTGCGNSCSSAS